MNLLERKAYEGALKKIKEVPVPAELEAEINESFEFLTEQAASAADGALRRFDEAAAKAERDRKAAEFRKRLDAGVHVNVGKPYYGAKEEEVKTVERITAKCLFFKEDYGGRTKLDEALQNLVNGTWRIAE